ncbi:MAG: nucleotidyl transferase AbiEii/AbiGii toxin family protein [Candidatus Scalindua sp.]
MAQYPARRYKKIKDAVHSFLLTPSHYCDLPTLVKKLKKMPNPHLKGYPLESKDFFDLWLMIRRFDFKGTNLTEALKKTFNHRKTALPEKKPLFAEEIYDENSDRQTLWKAFLTKGQIKHALEKLGTTAKAIEKFLTLYKCCIIIKNYD